MGASWLMNKLQTLNWTLKSWICLSSTCAINLHFALKVLQARKVPPFINLLPAAKLWLRSGYLPTMKSIVPFQCQLRRHLTTAAMEIYVDPVMDLCNRRPVPSTDQALPSCFYFRISWILMEQLCFYFFCPLGFLQGLRYILSTQLLQAQKLKSYYCT